MGGGGGCCVSLEKNTGLAVLIKIISCQGKLKYNMKAGNQTARELFLVLFFS